MIGMVVDGPAKSVTLLPQSQQACVPFTLEDEATIKLKKSIDASHLNRGDSLPPIEAVATMLGVTNQEAAAALLRLKYLGVLTRDGHPTKNPLRCFRYAQDVALPDRLQIEIPFEPVTLTPTPELRGRDIESYIIEQITSGAWPPGTKIPTIREIGTQVFGNPETSKKAVNNTLQRLAKRGILVEIHSSTSRRNWGFEVPKPKETV